MGWGGRRPGSGRKPTPKFDENGARVLTHPSAPSNVPATVDEFDPPASLTPEELVVWKAQAPYAFRSGTLTRQSAMSFERYCRVVVLEQNEAKSSGVGGANHRGLLKQINAYELQFLLTPCGKPLPMAATTAQQPESKLAKFRS